MLQITGTEKLTTDSTVTCCVRGTAEGPTRTKSTRSSLKSFIKSNLKLVKRCSEEYSITNRLMHSVKKFGLPKNRIVFQVVADFAPVIRTPIFKQATVETPCSIKFDKPHPLPRYQRRDMLQARRVAIATYNKMSKKFCDREIVAIYDLQTYRADIYKKKDAESMIEGLKSPLVFSFYGHIHMYKDKAQYKGWVRDLTIEGIEPNPGPRNNNNRNNNNNKNNNRKNGNRRVRRRPNAMMLGERPSLIMPPRHVANFVYVDSAYVRNNPGNNFLVYSFRINDLYDPDPLILSGSVSGFKEMMQFYAYYRVLNFSANINVSNNEAFDIFYGAVFSQSNLTGVIASRDDAANALENNYAKGPFLLSEKTGMDRGTLKLRVRPSSLLGVPRQYFSDTNYAGSGLATPPIPLWLNFIVYSPTGAALTNGYTTSTKLYMRSEFFGRLNLRA